MTSKTKAAPHKKPVRKSPPSDKEQSARFKETARALGVDESGKAFDRALKVVVPAARASKPTE